MSIKERRSIILNIKEIHIQNLKGLLVVCNPPVIPTSHMGFPPRLLAGSSVAVPDMVYQYRVESV